MFIQLQAFSVPKENITGTPAMERVIHVDSENTTLCTIIHFQVFAVFILAIAGIDLLTFAAKLLLYFWV